MAFWLKNKQTAFIWLSAFNILVFRSELCIISGIMLLVSLFKGRVSILSVIKNGLLATIVSVFLSVAIDSYFWNFLVWPEGQVFYFNTALNKSHEWGTLPFGWYFYSAIPRAMLISAFLIPFGLSNEKSKTLTYLVLPALGFVFVYSFLPHKELRFIIYIFPLLNCVAAKGLDDL
jgi:alpha-1,6-mannosyltransferase